ncbi:hypothetical protein ACFY1B_43520 [Streptomyces mirabilis]|uniref:hypothetical protein n=1 Tax=Streptomyces mirabilis TaxID=68239 RepID=UPI00368EA0A3
MNVRNHVSKPVNIAALPHSPRDRSDVARAAASCGLRLPIQFSYAETLDKAIAGRR